MTKLGEVVDWLAASQTRQIIVVAVAAVLILACVWILIRRRNKASAKPMKAPMAMPTPASGLQEVFEAYRESHPAFYNIMTAVQENRRLDEFMANHEFAGAVAKLRIWQAARRASRSDKDAKQAILRIDQANRADQSNHEVRAAMVTILRVLYSSPDVSESIVSRAEVEMDRLLESLTG